MNQHLWRYAMTVASVLVLLALAIAVFAYSGVYGVGADDPHTKPIFALLQTLRYRSIHVRSEPLVVPNLEDPKLILQGAGQYAAMCTGCHLRPGMKNSEIRPGLYPLPPNLSQQPVDPKDAFWTIKHGIKMSAMPAWGASHDDATIWSMVAFLQKLPHMSTEEYLDTVRRAPPDTDMDMDGPNADESKSHSHEDADHEHAEGSEADRHDQEHEAGSEKAGATDAAVASIPSVWPRARSRSQQAGRDDAHPR